ncbi:phosphatase PAP2 family protein [Sphingomonas sp.]|uniref:phosphatase PAP2 family protein n=1 Tax=Sphingomonas sp. TaxID=28214 RepID=UPI0025F9E261|nr:phosphatase PAP2 family protein [Sphingomonas sp.]
MTGRVSKSGWWGLALIVASLALGIAATGGYLTGFDRPVFQALALTRAHSSGWTIAVAQAFSWLGSASVRSVYILPALLVLAMRHHWRDILLFVVVIALTVFSDTALKEVFGRVRPALVPWLDNPANLSYPSGHSANSMVVLLLSALLIADRRLVGAAIALAAAVGISRVSLGVHWPSDVVGGWMFGGGAALVGASLSRRTQTRPTSVGSA